jgi:hypothetical protein
MRGREPVRTRTVVAEEAGRSRSLARNAPWAFISASQAEYTHIMGVR